MSIENVFIDNGGVITDNSLRGPQYRSLVADWFTERFGGKREVWEEANVSVFPGVWQRFLQRVENWHAGRDITHEVSLYYADWLSSMLSTAGADADFPKDECAIIGKEIDDWINPQIDARFPGVEDAVATLASRFRLFTASDGFSEPLAVALGPCAASIQRLYGPDLVNIPKSAGRPYYDAIFADAGVDPARTLVVDDSLPNVLAARSTGARAVFVTQRDDHGYDGAVIARLAELPSLIEGL